MIGRPPPRQLSLLRAALRPGEDGLAAWRAAVSENRRVVTSGNRLLPLIYKNLRGFGDIEPSLGCLEKGYLDTWVINRQRWTQAAAALDVLESARIQVILLKGTALAQPVYQDWGARPMSDVDMLVPHADAEAATQALLRAGYQLVDMTQRELTALMRTEHGCSFQSPGGSNIDLHWHLGLQCHRGWDAMLWERARDSQIEGRPVRLLAPTEAFFHVIVHGCLSHVYRDDNSGRWVADSVTIARVRASELDWHQLADLAAERGLSGVVAGAARYLLDEFRVDIPLDVLSRMETVPLTAAERLESWTTTVRVPSNRRALNTITRYLRIRAVDTYRSPWRGLPLYLQHTWGLDHGWQVPWVLASKIAKKADVLARHRRRLR